MFRILSDGHEGSGLDEHILLCARRLDPNAGTRSFDLCSRRAWRSLVYDHDNAVRSLARSVCRRRERSCFLIHPLSLISTHSTWSQAVVVPLRAVLVERAVKFLEDHSNAHFGQVLQRSALSNRLVLPSVVRLCSRCLHICIKHKSRFHHVRKATSSILRLKQRAFVSALLGLLQGQQATAQSALHDDRVFGGIPTNY